VPSHHPTPSPSRGASLALRDDDFAAYGNAQKPALNHAPNAQDQKKDGRRPDLGPRMGAWAGAVIERLGELDVEVGAVVSADPQSTEVAFVTPSEAARATRLVLRVDGAGVRAGLELPFEAARAARGRLADPARALELATALEALPEQFRLGSQGDGTHADGSHADGTHADGMHADGSHADGATAEAPRATADDLRSLLDRVERDRRTMWIGWTLPRALAVEHAALLDEQLADAVVALAQVFALLAEPGADDAAAGARRAARDRRFSGRRGKDEGVETKKNAQTRAGNGRDDPRARGPRVRAWDREREPEGEEAEPEPAGESALPRAHPFQVRLPLRPGARRRPSKGAKPIERGARVRVLRGPFSGKVGVVQELDGKGGARVMLGLLAVRLEVNNVVSESEGTGRPRLSSSHRKPIPARS
jgi:hypothetical protein